MEKEIQYLEFNKTESSFTALFFHGYGAGARDMSAFQSLKLPVSCRWIFPEGFLKLPAPYDTFGGRAWFPLKMDSEKGLLYPTKPSVQYLDKHCQKLLKFIQALNVKSHQMILGGFSQGAIMALNLALRIKPPPRALIVMSGSLFPMDVLYAQKKELSSSGSFFQCHGKTDPLLSYASAEKLCDFLRSLKWKGDFVSFEGGHEVPHAVLLEIQKFITQKLS